MHRLAVQAYVLGAHLLLAEELPIFGLVLREHLFSHGLYIFCFSESLVLDLRNETRLRNELLLLRLLLLDSAYHHLVRLVLELRALEQFVVSQGDLDSEVILFVVAESYVSLFLLFGELKFLLPLSNTI